MDLVLLIHRKNVSSKERPLASSLIIERVIIFAISCSIWMSRSARPNPFMYFPNIYEVVPLVKMTPNEQVK